MRTWWQFGLWVDVKIQTLITVRTVSVPNEKIAFWHLSSACSEIGISFSEPDKHSKEIRHSQIVLVQKFTGLPLLAQASEPMLAY
jgi:hypothetical protein